MLYGMTLKNSRLAMVCIFYGTKVYTDYTCVVTHIPFSKRWILMSSSIGIICCFDGKYEQWVVVEIT